MSALEKDVIYRLYIHESNGKYLEIKPNPDAPSEGIVLKNGDNQVSKDWFGEFCLYLQPEELKELGKALINYYNVFDKEN